MPARDRSFQSAHLCVLFVFLALWRYASRVALGTRFRRWLQEHLPPWLGDVILFLSQWWVILTLVLIVELLITVVQVHDAVDVTITLKGDMGWIAYFSVMACPACVVTYLLSLVSVFRQIFAAWKDNERGKCGWYRDLRWVLQYPRDVAIQVLFLPMVYHLMMCRSVLRQWSAISGRYITNYDGLTVEGGPLPEALKHELELSIAGANACLAEMYDAYALWCFGNLGMLVADRQLSRGSNNGSNNSTLDRTSVFVVLKSTLLFGVQAYVITAVLGALYSIALAFVNLEYSPLLCNEVNLDPLPMADTSSYWANGTVAGSNGTIVDDVSGTVDDSQLNSGWCTFKNVIYGADFATSTIAIYNLFNFEHQLHSPLKKFNPGLKFWSMKVPVTLAFSEIIVLKLTQPFTGLPDNILELVDTLSKAFFMILVALLNVFAWTPTEEWYYWDEVCEVQECRSMAVDDETETESGTEESEISEAEEAPPERNPSEAPLPQVSPLPQTSPLPQLSSPPSPQEVRRSTDSAVK